MSEEKNDKKQVAALWILGVLVVILIAIIIGLFIKQEQTKKQEVKIAQMEQELAQVNNQLPKEQNNYKNESQIIAESNNTIETNEIALNSNNTVKNENSMNTNITNTNLELGRYPVVPDKNLLYDEGLGRAINDMHIDLKENNEFTIYDSSGNSYYGKYTINRDTLILDITKWFGESGITEGVEFTVEENAQIKLKIDNGTLEVVDAPKSIKARRSDGENRGDSRGNMLNIKIGVKYSKTNSQVNILGEWRAYRLIDENGKELSLDFLFGSLIRTSNKLTFREDMRYINSVGGSGAGEGNEEGKYTITGNTITLEDLNHRIRVLTYNEANDVLTEDYNGDGTRIVTYIRN